jgi:hypothetical protein
MSTVDAAVLAAVSVGLSRPGLPEEIAAATSRLLSASRARGRARKAQEALQAADAEIARIVDAIREVGISPALADALREAEGRKAKLEDALSDPPAARKVTAAQVRREITRLREGLAGDEIATTRKMLKTLIRAVEIPREGPPRIIPHEGGLLTGMV